MHRKPVPLLPGSCCLSDEPVAEIVQCGDARSEDAPRGKLRSNFGAIAPKQEPKPGKVNNQKTKPGNTINNLERSAKPPSPGQIRAAPPNSLRNSREWAVPASAGDSYCSEKPSNRSSVRRATLCKSLHRDKLSARDLPGEEVQRTSALECRASSDSQDGGGNR